MTWWTVVERVLGARNARIYWRQDRRQIGHVFGDGFHRYAHSSIQHMQLSKLQVYWTFSVYSSIGRFPRIRDSAVKDWKACMHSNGCLLLFKEEYACKLRKGGEEKKRKKETTGKKRKK